MIVEHDENSSCFFRIALEYVDRYVLCSSLEMMLKQSLIG
jgi:hypothetical protein